MADITQARGSTASTTTGVAQSASSVTILNATQARDRKGVIVENAAAERLYLLFGPGTAAVSSGNYTASLGQNEKYESGAGMNYVGEITGIWASGTGSFAQVTVSS